MKSTDCAVVFLFNYLELIFLCVVVTKAVLFDLFDWPITLRTPFIIWIINIQYIL